MNVETCAVWRLGQGGWPCSSQGKEAGVADSLVGPAVGETMKALFATGRS